jgi:hypothetical protein
MARVVRHLRECGEIGISACSIASAPAEESIGAFVY